MNPAQLIAIYEEMKEEWWRLPLLERRAYTDFLALPYYPPLAPVISDIESQQAVSWLRDQMTEGRTDHE